MKPYLADPDVTIWNGDSLDVLRTLPDESIHCCVTSPPYWGLRDYGHEGQIGLEQTPDEYVARMVEVFREVRRVLRVDGTCWLNLGDSYAGSRAGEQGATGQMADRSVAAARSRVRNGGAADQIVRGKRNAKRWGGGNLPHVGDLKPKDLVGIPWRVAFALQADGWWLRSDIIWAKPNPMPESVTDRPTKAHEYVFLLTKSARYWYDADAIREAYKYDGRTVTVVQGGEGSVQHRNGERWPGLAPTYVCEELGWTAPDGLPEHERRRRSGNKERKPNPAAALGQGDTKHGIPWTEDGTDRNARSVWEIATQPYPEAHFAVFPQELARRCIAAGCPTDGTVLDPFLGSGTTAYVARKLGRKAVGIELNPAYCELAAKRLAQQSLFASESAA